MESRALVDVPGSVVVFLIEDSRIARSCLGETLADAGFSCRSFADGRSALAALDVGRGTDDGRVNQSPAAVVLDLSLPDVSPPEWIASFRAHPGHENTPIIGLARDAAVLAEVIPVSGPALHPLPKPVDPWRLLRTLREVLALSVERVAMPCAGDPGWRMMEDVLTASCMNEFAPARAEILERARVAVGSGVAALVELEPRRGWHLGLTSGFEDDTRGVEASGVFSREIAALVAAPSLEAGDPHGFDLPDERAPALSECFVSRGLRSVLLFPLLFHREARTLLLLGSELPVSGGVSTRSWRIAILACRALGLLETMEHQASYLPSLTNALTHVRRREARTPPYSESCLATILDSAGDGFVIIDETARILLFNPAAERLFGYTRDEVVSRNVSMLMPEPYRSGHEGYLARYFATGEKRVIGREREVVGLRKDGSTIPLGIMITEMTHGGERQFLGVLRDLTARKELEAQLRQSQKMEALGLLAGGIAHDFNNLLTVILGNSELALFDLSPDAPVAGNVAQIQEAAERATALTRQLLVFGRKRTSEPRVLDADRVISAFEPILTRLIGEHIEVRLRLAANAKCVRVDPHQLEQIVLNLALNARDAMPAGGTISITTGEISRFLRITVSDTGTGMDKETAARIFEPFFTTKAPGKGTGLGLSTVHGIVKQCGGTIEVESAPGVGTTFLVHLPTVDDTSSVDLDASESRRREAISRDATATGPIVRDPERIRTVLVAEDDERVLEFVKTTLVQAGYLVVEARNGAVALEELRSGRVIDLLVSDSVMPKLCGPDLAGLARTLRPSLPVILMSGYPGDHVVPHSADGVNTYRMDKPIARDALLRLASHAISQLPD